MWYDALEIARFIITICTQSDKPVSNLKLQKMLYFIWVDYFKQTGRWLFHDDICAWQLGPVVPKAYYEYCSYAGRPISAVYAYAVNEEDRNILKNIIERYINIPANVLVNRTHNPGTAWDVIYSGGAGNREVIPFRLIIEREAG